MLPEYILQEGWVDIFFLEDNKKRSSECAPAECEKSAEAKTDGLRSFVELDEAPSINGNDRILD